MKFNFDFVYEFGRKYTFAPQIESWDKKFRLVDFEYNSREVLSGMIIFLIIFLFLALLTFPIQLVSFSFGFFGLIIFFGAFLWSTSIIYSQRLVGIREEMLQLLLELSNHI